MKKLISTVLALSMAASLAGCGSSAAATPSSTADAVSSESTAAADTDLAYIQGKGKMTIGYTVYEPMNYTDADGNFTGFDTELATAVCAKLGRPCAGQRIFAAAGGKRQERNHAQE